MNNKNLELFANATGILGILITFLTALVRLLGLREMLGFESITLLVGAIALMASSCVVQLHLIRKS